MNSGLKQAIENCNNSQAELVRRVNAVLTEANHFKRITGQYVQNWIRAGKVTPWAVPWVSKATGVPAKELNDSIAWEALKEAQ